MFGCLYNPALFAVEIDTSKTDNQDQPLSPFSFQKNLSSFVGLRLDLLIFPCYSYLIDTETRLTKMFALILMEYENSLPDARDELTMAQAYAIASKGCYYKAQIINEHGVIEYEF